MIFSLAADRAVVLGNHRDAWVFGAVDPNSGTAVLQDVAKGIGKLRSDYGKSQVASHSYGETLDKSTIVFPNKINYFRN